MFPTTVWTVIERAGSADRESLERFAAEYRPPVLSFIRSRGFGDADAEDICQEVFLKLLRGNVLAKAEAARGRFRSLLLSVTKHTILDRRRRAGRREFPAAEPEVSNAEPDFDRAWVLHLVERALARLAAAQSPYYPVLRDHLEGRPQERQKLWIARRKLIAAIRAEVAGTCGSHRQFEDEVAYLSRFLGRA